MDSGHILRVRLTRGDADGSTPDAGGTATDYAVVLLQGTTTIASIGTTTAPTDWTTVALNLTSGEAAAITDYTDLRVHVTASGGAGSPANRRDVAVSWVELEVPDYTAPTVETGSFAADSLLLAVQEAALSIDAVALVSVTDSFGADSEIEATTSPAPIWTDPADLVLIQDLTPTLAFMSPASSNQMHFEIQLDTADTFDTGDLRVYRSFPSAAGWEFDDGDSWEPLSNTGLDPAFTSNEVRFTVPTALSGGVWFRRVRASI